MKKKFLLKEQVLVKLRHSGIPDYFIGKSIKVHNGAWFLSTRVSKNMIGLKFGAFSFTKKHEGQARVKRKAKKKSKSKKR